MFGFLNVYKPRGLTSHDVVARLRRITKIKQIGHTGTLDPFAEGVLPICIGKATRLIEYLDDNKAYEATIQLGASTNTYDLEGEIVETSDKKASLTSIEAELENFRGEIEQKPPIFSAIKIKGKKLYEYARKGEKIEVPSRQVTIYKLELLEFNEIDQTIRVLVECSKGTYIRSIAHDLGLALGTYGHLTKLVRVYAGKFELKNSIELETLEIETVKEKLIYPLEMLSNKQQELNEQDFSLIKNGMQLNAKNYNHDIKNEEIITLTFNKELVAIAKYSENKFIPQKVFI